MLLEKKSDGWKGQIMQANTSTMNKRIHRTVRAGFAGLIISLFGVVAAAPSWADVATLSAGIGPATNSAVPDKPAAAASAKNGSKVEAEIVVSSGYRVDKFDWKSSAGINLFGEAVNISSKLTWDDLEIFQLKFQGKLVLPRIIALKGSLDYGWIFNGENQDSDFIAQNGNIQEFSRTENGADDGDVMDASFGVGYPFRWVRTMIWGVTPMVGYSHHKQNLTIRDGNQIIPNLGSFPGLNSRYETQWQGPWIGLDLRFKAKEIKTFFHRLQPYLTVEYHWADYTADADWNLRKDLAHPTSFKHNADGHGTVYGAGFNVALTHPWALNINLDYQDWSINDGKDKIFFADGTTEKVNLDEVNWKSYALSLGLALQF